MRIFYKNVEYESLASYIIVDGDVRFGWSGTGAPTVQELFTNMDLNKVVD